LDALIFQSHQERLRQKLLRLVDGNQICIHYAHQVFCLKHGERVCDWLLTRGFKGLRLEEWVREKHAGSILNAISFIVADVNRAAQQAVRVGDFHGH